MKKHGVGLVASLMVALLATGSAIAIENNPIDGDGGTGGKTPGKTSSGMSYNDDLGCKIAVCLSNPAGPTAVSECIPPITEMNKLLAKGKTVPLCPFS